MRQFEHPVPNLEVAADDNQLSETSSHSNEVRNSLQNNVDEVELELSALVENNGTNNVDALEVDPLNDSEIDIKPDPLSLFEGNRDLIENLLTDTIELEASDSSEEIIFLNDCTVFPMPMKCDIHDLVKRENDEMSGNISYNEKVIFQFTTQTDHSLSLSLLYIIIEGWGSHLPCWRKLDSNFSKGDITNH